MTILCGTDFSPASSAACEVAALLAAVHGEPLVLVHAVSPVTVPPPHDLALAVEGVVTSADQELRDLAQRLGGGTPGISTSVQIGAADEVLLAEAGETARRRRRVAFS